MGFLGEIGGAIIGGFLGEEQADDRNEMAIRFRNEDYARQKEFAQNGILWRTQDAKRAGIHPVFALQGGGAAYASSPIAVNDDTVDYMRMGQDLGRAVDSVSTPEARRARQLSEDEIASRITRNNAEADMFRSITVKNYGAGVGPGMPSQVLDPNITAVGGTSALVGDASGQISVQPSSTTSYALGDPSVAAASDVMWKQYSVRLGDGKVDRWWLPNANSVSEALEAVSESLPLQWMVLKENMKRNPYFAEENAHLVPFIDELKAGADFAHGVQRFGGDFVERVKRDWSWLPRLYDTFKKGYSYRESSGRDRGVNWRAR